MFNAQSSFGDLRMAVEAAGCFRTAPWRALLALPLNLLLALAGFSLARFGPVWLAIPAFVGGSFFFYRLGWLMHDAAHHATFASRRANRRWAAFVAGLLGEFPSGWSYGHNRHHRAPNVRGIDGDQSERWDASRRYRSRFRAFLALFITNRRGRVVLPTSLLFLGLRDGYYCYRHFPLRFRAELAGVLIGIALQLAGFVLLFGHWGPLLFLLHTHLGMLYLNSVFAANHYDLASFDEAEGLALPFAERQYRTSRNYLGPRWQGLIFGGLEFQIEHHLFPNMPRHQLPRAVPYARAFAAAKGLPYHEASFIDSFARVLDFHVEPR